MHSPKTLDAQLDLDPRNNFTKTGVFNRDQLDGTFSAMTRTVGARERRRPSDRSGTLLFSSRWDNRFFGHKADPSVRSFEGSIAIPE